MAKIIIMQGMTCLGKSTLCERLADEIPKCKHYSLDIYKENMWDKFGFDSVAQREHQSELARQLYYSEIAEDIRVNRYDYYLLDYVFSEKYWAELQENLNGWELPVKTIYLHPADLETHSKVWHERSRDFSVRHPGHGATHYHDGVGSDYVNKYAGKVLTSLPVTNTSLDIAVSFNPYNLSMPFKEIVQFVTATPKLRTISFK